MPAPANRKRKKAGRPSHKPTPETRKLVELAAAVGTPHHDIASLIRTGTRQLLRDYPEEIALGKIRANVKIGGTLYNAAVKGNITAMIFWQKCQAGWSERSRVEVTGADGGPIASAAVAAEATDEDSMRAYLAMLKQPGKE